MMAALTAHRSFMTAHASMFAAPQLYYCSAKPIEYLVFDLPYSL